MRELDALNVYEAEGERINIVIADLAEEIAEFRGDSLTDTWDPRYGGGGSRTRTYDKYERCTMGEYYRNHRRLRYDDGTKLIGAQFGAYCGDQYETQTVYFPESYLDDADWAAKEQVFVDMLKGEDARKAAAAAARDRAEDERQFAELAKRLGK